MPGDEEVQEPDNSTVDDWFGQNVARDEEVAEQAMRDAGGNETKAEELFEQRASGEETYEEGHAG